MEFRIQEIFKNLLPSFTLIIITHFIVNINDITLNSINTPDLVKNMSSVFLLIILAGVYIIGYFIDAIASFLERFVLYRIFRRPSIILLNDVKNRYQLASRIEILENLCNRLKKAPPQIVNQDVARELFNVANELKDNNKSNLIKEKVSEYYNSYIFSRNLMIAILFSLLLNIIFVFLRWDDFLSEMIIMFLFLIFFFSISVFRWRNRAYYYSRQVLLASYY